MRPMTITKQRAGHQTTQTNRDSRKQPQLCSRESPHESWARNAWKAKADSRLRRVFTACDTLQVSWGEPAQGPCGLEENGLCFQPPTLSLLSSQEASSPRHTGESSGPDSWLLRGASKPAAETLRRPRQHFAPSSSRSRQVAPRRCGSIAGGPAVPASSRSTSPVAPCAKKQCLGHPGQPLSCLQLLEVAAKPKSLPGEAMEDLGGLGGCWDPSAREVGG